MENAAHRAPRELLTTCRILREFQASVSQTKEDGTDIIHQQKSGIDLASRINLLRLKRSWQLGVADLLCKIPVANDSNGFLGKCNHSS